MVIKLWPNDPDCSCEECSCDQSTFGKSRECDCMECNCEKCHEDEEDEEGHLPEISYAYPTSEEEWDTQP